MVMCYTQRCFGIWNVYDSSEMQYLKLTAHDVRLRIMQGTPVEAGAWGRV